MSTAKCGCYNLLEAGSCHLIFPVLIALGTTSGLFLVGSWSWTIWCPSLFPVLCSTVSCCNYCFKLLVAHEVVVIRFPVVFHSFFSLSCHMYYSLHPKKQVILGFKICPRKQVILPYLESVCACKNQLLPIMGNK